MFYAPYLDDAIAHYELFLSNKLIKVGEVQLKDKQIVTDSIKITDVDYMSELKLNVLVVKCGEVFTHSASCMAVDTLRLYALLKKYGPLKMQWSHYSRLMNPGNKESWRLTVKYSDSTAQIPVEVLACMYDISLDKIIEYPNYNKFPDFSSSFTTKLYGCLDFNNITTEPIYTNHQDASKIYPKMSLKEIRYEKLRYRFSGKDMTKNIESAQGVFSQDGDMTSARGSRFDGETRTIDGRTGADKYDETTTGFVAGSSTPTAGEMMNGQSSTEKKGNSEMCEEEPLEVTSSGQGMAHNNHPSLLLSKVTPRTNFAETAFFYPELYTNEHGEVSFEFTAPEQLTRWKFMAWAHTQNLQYGYFSETMVTQRPLMVMPNRPRFLREGDTLLFQVKVTNLNPSNSKGTIRLSWINPETEQPVTNVLLEGAEQSFECNSLSSIVVQWKMTVPSHFPVLKYSVVAVGQDLDNPLQYFSDGEENVLPVLSLITQIVDAQSFYVRQDSTWSLPLDLSAYGDSAQHQLVVHT
ncbi:MAG: alpha-2-macroglobulin family protein, partial [Bacteroidales bacterium]|nr:alpha-2-macroglobulin family protein [Bacteroidales bacterium]